MYGTAHPGVAEYKSSLVLFAADWAEVRGGITRHAKRALCSNRGWDVLCSYCLAQIFPISTPWSDHNIPPPRSQSGDDLLPFPTTAMTQMRLLYHCQQQLLGLASLVCRGWTLGTCVSAQSAGVSGPTHCCLSPGRLLCNNCTRGAVGGGVCFGGLGGRAPFQLSGTSVTSWSVNSESSRKHPRGIWSARQITPPKPAPVQGSRFAPPAQRQSEMGRRRGREG